MTQRPALRRARASSTGLKRFPYVIYYVAIDERVDIWRVLHTRRDVPRTFGDID